MKTLLALILSLSATCAFAADEAKKDPNAGVVIDPVAAEVWTTENGTKYHLKDCPNAKIKTTIAQSIVEGDTPCKQCNPPVYDPAKVVVFAAGEKGGKYHLYSCRYAKTQTTLKQALADSLTPCGTCKPPVLWEAPKAGAAAATAAPAK